MRPNALQAATLLISSSESGTQFEFRNPRRKTQIESFPLIPLVLSEQPQIILITSCLISSCHPKSPLRFPDALSYARNAGQG